MEQVGFLFQLVDARRKQMTVPAVIRKELKDCIRAVLRIITSLMLPSAYFEGIVRLLHHEDKNLGKKVAITSAYRRCSVTGTNYN